MSGICLLIAAVPVYCFSITFIMVKVKIDNFFLFEWGYLEFILTEMFIV